MRTRIALAIGLLSLAAGSTPALADLLPSPNRPIDWDEHPAPVPAPPPEKEDLAPGVLALVALAMASTALLRKRARAALPVEQG